MLTDLIKTYSAAIQIYFSAPVTHNPLGTVVENDWASRNASNLHRRNIESTAEESLKKKATVGKKITLFSRTKYQHRAAHFLLLQKTEVPDSVDKLHNTKLSYFF